MTIFPSGIAEGESFCNRVLDRKRLKENIEKLKHTVLMAPRRYGKTSLIRQVILENDFKYVWIDFLPVTTKNDIEEKFKKACKKLLFKLAPELKKLQLQTKKLVDLLSPELNLSAMGQTLTLHLTSDQPISIDEMLLQIDKYAQKVGKIAVLVLDEFQQVSEIEQHIAVEALIRHAVERSKAITYVFSGSNRHLLGEMFSKSDRPLYRLCQAMMLNRIEGQEYTKFLNKAAKKQWGKNLSENVLQTIVKLTECHTFYVNALCSELWSFKNIPKTPHDVETIWQWYINTHKSIIISDIISLPLNQKKIIAALAQKTTKEIYGATFSFSSKISTSSIRRGIDALLAKDIIYADANGEYKLIDPAIRYYLLNN